MAGTTFQVPSLAGLNQALATKVSTTDPRLSDARPPTAHTHTMTAIEGLEEALESAGGSGGGGSTATLVASGAIPGTNIVATLNSDGTVSTVSGRNTIVGASAFIGPQGTFVVDACYHPIEQKVVVAYTVDWYDEYSRRHFDVVVAVGSVAATTITWSGSKQFHSVTNWIDTAVDIRVMHHAPTNRVVVVSLSYTEDSGTGDRLYCITASLLSISGSAVAVYGTWVVAPDFSAQRKLGNICEGAGTTVVSHYYPNAIGCLTPLVVTQTTITGGTTVQFSGMVEAPKLAFSPETGRFIAIYGESGSIRVGAFTTALTRVYNEVLHTVEVNDMTTGSLVPLAAGRMLAVWRNQVTTSPLAYATRAKVFTPATSGISGVGQMVTVSALSGSAMFAGRAVFDASADRVVFVSGTSTTVTQMQIARLVDNSIELLDSPVEVTSRHASFPALFSMVYLPGFERVLMASLSGSIVAQVGFTTAANRVGFFTQPAAAGAQVSVSLPGSVLDGFVGLTPRKLYYVNNDGSITTANLGAWRLIGYALSPTQLLITFDATGLPL